MTSNTTTKTLTTKVSSRLEQDDIDAIETAYSHFKALMGTSHPTDQQLMQSIFEAEDTAAIRKNDPAAWAFVSAKHGYDPTGKPLGNGVVADPDWV